MKKNMSVYCPPKVHQSLYWTLPPDPVARIFQDSDGAGVNHAIEKVIVQLNSWFQ